METSVVGSVSDEENNSDNGAVYEEDEDEEAEYVGSDLFFDFDIDSSEVAAAAGASEIKGGDDSVFYAQKIATATFYAAHILPRCSGHAGAIANAEGTLQTYPVDWL